MDESESPKELVLRSSQGLRSHYPDTGAYETRTQQWFRERFEALNSDWRCEPGQAPITLGDVDVILPDFCFRKGDKTAYLEIVGYWNPERLQTHIKAVHDYGRGNIIVAVSRKLNGSKSVLENNSESPLIDFAEVIPAKRVLQAIESVAC